MLCRSQSIGSKGSPSVSRIPPLPESEWPDDVRPMLEVEPPGLGSRLGDNNIFATLARHGDLFGAWLPFGGFLLTRGVLTARERELLIPADGLQLRLLLRVGTARRDRRSGRRRARRGAARGRGPGRRGLDARRRRAAARRRRAARRSKISKDTWAALCETHDERGLIKIAMLVGHYHMVAFALSLARGRARRRAQRLPGNGDRPPRRRRGDSRLVMSPGC